MANKVSVELQANVKGFVDGMNSASDSAKQYETDTRKIQDATVNFNKELRKAKTEVKNLAAGYAQLDKEAKKSAFGQEMKRQLDAAKKAAAEYIDLQGDLQAELKNMASDTKALDTLSESIGVLGDVTSGVLGAIAMFTGEEEDARKAVVAFTTAQSIANGVTKVALALQPYSNTMKTVGTVKDLAAAAAIKIKTAAEGRGIITTKAATVAQAAFNAVAAANPYVLLAMAITGVIAALAAFTVYANNAEEAQKAESKATEEAKAIKEAYYNAYNSKLSDTMGNYIKLQGEWKALKSEGEKNQWIKDNEKAFHDLGFEINNTADAENFFVHNEQAVISSFIARAEAAAYAAQAVEVFNKALEGTPKAGDKLSVKEASKYGISEKDHKVERNIFSSNTIELTKKDEEKIRKIRLDEARKTSSELAQLKIKSDKEASEKAAQAGVKAYSEKRKKGIAQTIKAEKDSLAKAEEELRKLEDIRYKMSIDDSSVNKVSKQLDDKKKQLDEIKDKKVKLEIEVDENNKKIESLKKDINELENIRSKMSIDDSSFNKVSQQLEDKKNQLAAIKDKKVKLGIEVKLNDQLLETAKKELKELEDIYTKVNLDNPSLNKIKKQIEDKKKEIQEKRIRLGLEIAVDENSLEAAQEQLNKLEEIRSKMSVDSPDLDSVKKAIEAKKKEIQDKKIKLGIEVEMTATEKLDKFASDIKKRMEAIVGEYTIAFTSGDTEQIVKLSEEYDKLNSKLKAYNKAKENSKLQLEGVEVTPKVKKEDYDNAMSGNFRKSLDGYSEAISTLEAKLKDVDWDSMDPEGKEELWNTLTEQLTEYKDTYLEMQEEMDEATMTSEEKQQKALEKKIDTLNAVGDAIGACGDMFGELGELADSEEFNVLGIVAKAIATVALSYAQALASCKTWVEWLAFGISGLGTMIAMISQIKSATSGYAGGGIVGGSSYSGDRIMARVNSGEMILNSRQQRNLFNLLDSETMPQKGGTNVTVSGVIRGQDIMLVQKNTNKIRSKSGTSLSF